MKTIINYKKLNNLINNELQASMLSLHSLFNRARTYYVILGSLFVLGCSSDTVNEVDEEVFATSEGTIAELRKFYNDGFVDTMISLGFKVNEGKTPPNLGGSFLITPFVLNASNIDGDQDNIGEGSGDYQATFSNQNNDMLSIDFLGNSNSGQQLDEGNGSFVIGSNGSFGVFAKTTTKLGSSTAVTAVAISGTLTATGIENVQFFGAMLDDNGDPQKIFIENNSGRMYIDGDGLAEKVSSQTN